MSGVAIKVDHVSKSFKLPHEKHDSVKNAFVNALRRGKKTFEKQEVLQDISFEIKEGDFFGIVGRNGSGKSTLLKLLAGVYSPNEGTVNVSGKLTPFIELGVGFNPELTGRENVFLNGALLGFNRKEMEVMYEEIVRFAELEKFMDQKLKNYSSGMQVRLAFSIAIRAKSDILLIDEVLAVGDAAFQTKCFDYFMELKKTKKTVVLVSHDRGALERFCTKGILIDQGKIIPTNSIKEVLDKYSEVVLDQMTSKDEGYSKSQEVANNIAVKGVNIYDASGRATKKIKYGTDAKIVIDIEFLDQVTNPVIGATFWRGGVDNAVYAANNLTESLGEVGLVKKGEIITLEIVLPNVLNDGEYTIEVGVANEAATVFLLKKTEAAKFRIFGSNNPHSVIATQNSMSMRRNK